MDVKNKRKYRFHVSDEHKDKDPSTLTYGTIYEGFADKTTAHAISHVHIAKGIIKKLYWVFFSLGSVAALIYYGQTLVDKFFSWPVLVRVNVIHEPELIFPAVTVCNMNPVMKSSVFRDSYLRNMVGLSDTSNNENNVSNAENNVTLDTATIAGITHSPPTISVVGSTTLSGVKTTATKLPLPPPGRRKRQAEDDGPKNSGKPTNNKGKAMRGNFELGLQLEQYVAELDLESKMAMGHPIEDFILDCEYSGYECTTSEFYQFYNYKYGNCFVFNSGWNITDTSALEISRRPGPQYGLKLIFNIDQEEYVGSFADSAGVRITVHPQNSMPFPEDEGITIVPGVVTYVGLRKETIYRLGSPHGNCTEVVDEYKNVYQEFYKVNYTTQACLKTCIQIHTYKECGCGSSNYPLEGKAFGTNHKMSACDLTNVTYSDCVDSVMEKYKKGDLDCQCGMSCQEAIFSTTISTGYWPSDAYRGELFQTLADVSNKAKLVIHSRDEPDKYKNNFAKVNMFFEEFNLNNITEHEEYTAGQFVSDIGGILGLFIGFSVLTIMEFVELVMDFMVLYCLKFGKSNSNKPQRIDTITNVPQTDDKKSRSNAVSPPPPYQNNEYGNKGMAPIEDSMYLQEF